MYLRLKEESELTKLVQIIESARAEEVARLCFTAELEAEERLERAQEPFDVIYGDEDIGHEVD